MGSFSPVPGFGASEVAELVEQIHRPVVEELARRGAPFVGVLFAGLMLTEAGPKVLEFNARFGDPETQSILPRLDGDLLGALAAAAGGDLEGVELGVSDDAAVTVVLAAGGYPERSDAGTPIEGIEDGGGDRRTRLPRRNGAARRAAGHERRPHPRRHGDGRRRSPRRASRRTRGCERIRFEGCSTARDIALDRAAAPG